MEKFRRSKYQPLNRIEINGANIVDNYAYLQSLQTEAEILPVLKSNAYGHGLKELCTIMENTPANMLIVDSYPEAQIAYKYSTKKILILGEMPHQVYDLCNFKRTEFAVYNLATLAYLASLKKKAKIHLFLNTGMNREGILGFVMFFQAARKYLKQVEIAGLCSHLASAEENSNLNNIQIKRFKECLDILNHRGVSPQYVHLGNSAGIFTLKDQKFNAFRAGISLYGFNIFAKKHFLFEKAQKLKPAMKILSKVVACQHIKKGEIVSYNETFESSKSTNIAIIPFGYYEGLDRRLSNKAQFLVKSDQKPFYAQVAGRVCMNLTCLDCGSHEVRVGDEVEIVSDQVDQPNSVSNLALSMETIPYEFLVKIQNNIHRSII